MVSGSPSPGLTELDTEGWRKWLLEHPEEFKTLRGIAEVEDNFKDGDSTDIGSSA